MLKIFTAIALLVLASPAHADGDKSQVATFAGGCYWCVEADFDTVPGVVRTVSGFTAGLGGNRETVRIYFDPAQVSYATLLEIFWRSVDPTDDGGQFCDRGESYATAIFANSPEQRRQAEASLRALQDSKVLAKPVVTPIADAGPFTPAAEPHQDYYKKSPIRYKLYRLGCGRNARVKALWGADAYRGIALK